MSERRIHELEQIKIMLARQMQARGSRQRLNRRKERIQQNLIFTHLDQEASISHTEARRSSKSLEKNATDEMNEAKPECMICLSPYQMGETIAGAKTEECVHVFHKECIMEWFLKDRDDCPMCRTKILSLDAPNNKKVEVVAGGEEAV
jgi:hypothetical protein